MNSLSCTREQDEWKLNRSKWDDWSQGLSENGPSENGSLPWRRKSWRWNRGVVGCRWLWQGESVAGTCASSWQWSGGVKWVRKILAGKQQNQAAQLVNLVRPWAANNPPHCKHKNLFVKELEHKIPGKSTLLNSFQEFWPLHYFWAKLPASNLNFHFKVILKMFAACTLYPVNWDTQL